VGGFEPELVVSQLTDLPDDRGRIPELAAAAVRMYREGTRNVVTAALAAGARRIAAQSVAWRPPGETGDAVDDHERVVLEAGGLVIRYGRFFGPGTYFEAEPPPPPRIHVDDAARRTVPALDTSGGLVTIVQSAPPKPA
jgi:hypothetical protein